MCNSVPFHVPITLSVHISLGVRYSPVSLTVPVTQYGVSYFRFLLHRTDPHLSVRTFLYGKHLDPYIRGFRQSVVDNSHHRYFVDSRRVICIQYLYRTFVSRVATLLRQTSADFIELQTPCLYSRSRSKYQRRHFRALPRHSTFRVISCCLSLTE